MLLSTAIPWGFFCPMAKSIGWHVPCAQSPPSQSCPHTPQLFGSFASSASQPSFVRSLLQSTQPASHEKAQDPLLQLVCAWANDGHAWQLPQWFGLFSRSASHPVSASPSQSPHPWVHVVLQSPCEQTGWPLWSLQAWLQKPQLWMSLFVLVSQPSSTFPLQSSRPLAHTKPHVPFEQVVWVVPGRA
jgi:hypothetical protein